MSEQPIHTSTFNAITSVQKSRHHKEYNNPYAKKQFLIVDSVPEMQRALAMTLASFGAEPFLALPPPKSTGRDLFNADWLNRWLGPHGLPGSVGIS